MVIGICGKKGSGKDELAKLFTQRGFIKHAMAKPLKEAAKKLFGWGQKHLEGELKDAVDPRYGVSPRWWMQTEGDRLREHCDGFFVIRWLQEYDYMRNYVVPDVRYKDEAQMVRDLGGYLIHLDRVGLVSSDTHRSENQVIDCDFEVVNDNTKPGLRMAADSIFRRLGQGVVEGSRKE